MLSLRQIRNRLHRRGERSHKAAHAYRSPLRRLGVRPMRNGLARPKDTLLRKRRHENHLKGKALTAKAE